MTARPIGFQPWSPTPAVEAIINQVQNVLGQYAVYGPMTVRQIFYRLVATVAFPKTEQDYKRLAEYLVRARRAKYIRFDQIRDDGDTELKPDGYQSLGHVMETIEWIANEYTLRPDVLQPVHQIVMVEAAGMAPMVGLAAHPYGADVLSAGGFNGVTGKHALAQSIIRTWRDAGRTTTILHIGDHDPSGVHVFSNLEADVTEFVRDYGFPDTCVDFRRIAITPHQVTSLNIPTAPAKATDARSFPGIGRDPTATAQAEAIDPATLAQIIEAALLVDWDPALAVVREEQEEDEKRRLNTWLAGAGQP